MRRARMKTSQIIAFTHSQQVSRCFSAIRALFTNDMHGMMRDGSLGEDTRGGRGGGGRRRWQKRKQYISKAM